MEFPVGVPEAELKLMQKLRDWMYYDARADRSLYDGNNIQAGTSFEGHHALDEDDSDNQGSSQVQAGSEATDLIETPLPTQVVEQQPSQSSASVRETLASKSKKWNEWLYNQSKTATISLKQALQFVQNCEPFTSEGTITSAGTDIEYTINALKRNRKLHSSTSYILLTYDQLNWVTFVFPEKMLSVQNLFYLLLNELSELLGSLQNLLPKILKCWHHSNL